MCVYSMIGDWGRDTLPHKHPWIVPQPTPYVPHHVDPLRVVTTVVDGIPPQVTKAEFDALKRDVEDIKELLKRAKKYDEENGEPNCEVDEKVDLIMKIAELVGVDLGEALP